MGLGDEFNAALAAAALPSLVDWYAGEPRPLRRDSTPYGWFHWRPTAGVQAVRHKQGVETRGPLLLGLVLAAGTGAELMALSANVLPRLAAVLESRSWPCNAEVGGWELAVQDADVHLDVYALPVELTWWRAYGAVA